MEGAKPALHVEEKDIKQLESLRRSTPKTMLYYLGCVVSLGMLAVLFYWFPKLKRWLYNPCQLHKAKSMGVLEKGSKQYSIVRLKRRELKLLPYDNFRKMLFFDFKKNRYIQRGDVFQKVESFILQKIRKDFREIRGLKRGLNMEEVEAMKRLFGRNVIDIDLTPLFELFVQETVTVFFFFQIFSFVIWINNDYLVYAIIIILMTVFSICLAVYQTRKQDKKIRQMSFFEELVFVKRRDPALGQFYIKRISSLDLQPGDLVYLSPGRKVPADIVLLSGKCVVDESLLTGESTPCLKQSASELSELGEGSLLFGGSKCLVSECGETEIRFADFKVAREGEISNEKGESAINCIFGILLFLLINICY